MSTAATRFSPLRRLARWLLVACGTLVILLAVALGVFRLLIGQIPEYQGEIKAWVADELGIELDFAALDARLALTGPVLTLQQTSIGGPVGNGFLQAERATIALDPVALVLGRRVEIAGLILDRVDLTVERHAGGAIYFGEHALTPGPDSPQSLAVVTDWIPESVDVSIRNSELHYIDHRAARRWDFADLELAVHSDAGQLTASASATPPPALASRLDFSVEASLGPANPVAARWRARVAAPDLDLAAAMELVPVATAPSLAGRGRVAAEVRGELGAVDSVDLDVAMSDFRLGSGAAAATYDTLAFAAEWMAGGAGSWSVALDSVEVERGGRAWPAPGSVGFAIDSGSDGFRAVSLRSDFLRLDDLRPFALAFPATQLADQWQLFEPRGDIIGLDFALERQDDAFAYLLDAGFSGIALNQVGETPGIDGISGQVRATEDGGSVDFDSEAVSVDWPALFPGPVGAESLAGRLVWRQGRDDIQILSDGLAVGLFGEQARISFGARVPSDGSSPEVDIEASLASLGLAEAKALLPTPVLPGAVAAWLDRAIVAGTARNIEFGMFGPVRSFPFDDGSGQFRVSAGIEDATLAYMADWPPGEALNGTVDFLNAGFLANGAGRVLTNEAGTLSVAIPDLRNGLLTLSASTDGPLAGVVDFLRSAPLIAEHLGPDLGRVGVLGGAGRMDVDLDLPLRDLGEYELDASLDIADGALEIAGLRPTITEIDGSVRVDANIVSASDIDAVFLGGAMTAGLSPSELDGYRAELRLDGETTAEAVMQSFGLPHADFLAGQTLWSGRLLMPALDPLATTSTRVIVESNLTGVALRFPEPLAKPPGVPTNLRLDLDFVAGSGLEVSGNFGASRRFVLSFDGTDAGLQFARGAVRFGGDEPVLPVQSGVLVDGRLASVALDGWLELAGSSGLGSGGTPFLGADIEVGEFRAFGQQLGATSLRVLRGADGWEIFVDSEAIAGDISVPYGPGSREPIVADMRRVYLAGSDGGDATAVDPRDLPGIRLEAEEFGIGVRRLGRVSAVVDARPRGLVLSEFSNATDNFSSELSGSWFAQPGGGSRTRIDARIVSTDVAAAMAELGLDTVVSGESAEVTAAVYWDSAPGADWLDHVYGEVSLFVDTGTLREIDPGAGRVVGLMSIAALPRRLALDFRDVFEDGFAFDEISGDFRLIDGNAYTNNLMLDGPAAEIGVVGRTGLRDRDYTQQIGVSTEPSNMLPTVAGLIAGPGAGAAMFVFTRLFKRPLQGLGHLSYCLEGSWEEPVVEPIETDQGELAQRCADLPPELLETTTLE